MIIIWTLLIIAFLIIIFVLYFFRDPVRTPPHVPQSFIAPSDGKVIEASRERITIFMSIYDVHVNRVPYNGIVKSIWFRQGEYSKAYAKKATMKNEAILTTIKSKDGIYIVSQIAGIIARRIINNLEIGSFVKAGERMGMIRFGSNTSIMLPSGFQPTVKLGDFVRGGETIIARKHDED